MPKIEQAIAQMRKLVAKPGAAMRCTGCTGAEEETRVFACEHEVGAPARADELEAIREAEMDHETLSPRHRAMSLAEFASVIASETDRAVEWFNSDIRYCGAEDRLEQWFPVGVTTAGKVVA